MAGYSGNKQSACHRSPLDTVYRTLLMSLLSAPQHYTEYEAMVYWKLKRGQAGGKYYTSISLPFPQWNE